MNKKLKLLATTPQDIPVVSMLVQDGIVKIGDINFNPRAMSFSLRISRFRHESTDFVTTPEANLQQKDSAKGTRLISGLRIDSVLGVQSRLIDRANPDAFIVLLAIQFKPSDTVLGGMIILSFAGGGDIRIDVEAVDIILADVSEPRKTDKIPKHDIEHDLDEGPVPNLNAAP